MQCNGYLNHWPLDNIVSFVNTYPVDRYRSEVSIPHVNLCFGQSQTNLDSNHKSSQLESGVK